MKKLIFLLIALAILLIISFVYRSRSTRQLNVDPNAAQEILSFDPVDYDLPRFYPTAVPTK